MNDPVPDRLATALADRYRLERELGQGGMATVYLAHDLKHERDVAIKVLHPDLGAALGPERFLAEIKTTARLQHPHVLPLLDSGAADGLLFYVMPYVKGETLRARLAREMQLPVADALQVAREVLDALAEAHAQGIVHRDIKPENILLQGGHALVADFGIALAVQQAGGSRMTQTGLSLGTPQYMAPEQAMGDRSIDHRADLYATAAVLYEMLAGEPPFAGPNAQAIVAKLLTEAVRPIAVLRPAVPAHVDAAVQVGLQKLPADRFASAAEFRDALAGGVNSRVLSTVAMPTARLPRPRRAALAAALVATAAIAAVGGWLVGRRGSAPATAEGPALALPLAAVPGLHEAVFGSGGLAMHPDGTEIAFGAVDSANGSGMWVRRLTDGSVRQVATGVVSGAVYSPDGSQIAFANASALAFQVAPAAGGAPRTIAKLTAPRGYTWNTDSTLVVAGGPATGSALAVADVRTGRVDSVPADAIRQASDGGRLLFVTPSAIDAGHVLGAMVRGQGLEGELVAVRLADGALTRLGVQGVGPRWVEPDLVVFRRDGGLWAVAVDRRTFATRGAPRVLAPATAAGSVVRFAVSRTGTIVLQRGEAASERELLLVDRAGRARALFPERRAYIGPRFSPDGTRLAFLSGLNPSGGTDVWVADLASATQVRLTSDSSHLGAEWSPDGRYLDVAQLGRATADGVPRLRRLPVDGGSDTTTLLRRERTVYEHQLSRDGRTLVWREDVRGNARDIFTAPLAAPDSVRTLHGTRFDERGLALSPDGTWYAFTSDESGRSEIYLARHDRPGARWPVSRDGGVEPRWAATGELFFRHADSVYATRPVLGDAPRIDAPKALFGGRYMLQGYEPRWDVSPDGRTFALVRLPERAGLDFEVVLGWRGAFAKAEP